MSFITNLKINNLTNQLQDLETVVSNMQIGGAPVIAGNIDMNSHSLNEVGAINWYDNDSNIHTLTSESGYLKYDSAVVLFENSAINMGGNQISDTGSIIFTNNAILNPVQNSTDLALNNQKIATYSNLGVLNAPSGVNLGISLLKTTNGFLQYNNQNVVISETNQQLGGNDLLGVGQIGFADANTSILTVVGDNLEFNNNVLLDGGNYSSIIDNLPNITSLPNLVLPNDLTDIESITFKNGLLNNILSLNSNGQFQSQNDALMTANNAGSVNLNLNNHALNNVSTISFEAGSQCNITGSNEYLLFNNTPLLKVGDSPNFPSLTIAGLILEPADNDPTKLSINGTEIIYTLTEGQTVLTTPLSSDLNMNNYDLTQVANISFGSNNMILRCDQDENLLFRDAVVAFQDNAISLGINPLTQVSSIEILTSSSQPIVIQNLISNPLKLSIGGTDEIITRSALDEANWVNIAQSALDMNSYAINNLSGLNYQNGSVSKNIYYTTGSANIDNIYTASITLNDNLTNNGAVLSIPLAMKLWGSINNALGSVKYFCISVSGYVFDKQPNAGYTIASSVSVIYDDDDLITSTNFSSNAQNQIIFSVEFSNAMNLAWSLTYENN